MTSLIWRRLFNYLIHVGDATSQWVNVVFLMSKNPNESISGRAWRLRNESKAWSTARKVIDFLAFWEVNHCYLSYHADVRRAKELLAVSELKKGAS